MWEEEEKRLRLASAQEIRWLVELAAQQQRKWIVEVKSGESSRSKEKWKEEDRDCWGCWVWEEVCKQLG